MEATYSPGDKVDPAFEGDLSTRVIGGIPYGTCGENAKPGLLAAQGGLPTTRARARVRPDHVDSLG